jgi:4-hydroxy-tetrahydrodipicolinate synthase
MTPATLVAAAAIPGVLGVKDATGSLDTAMDLALSAPTLATLSGDDSLTLGFLVHGAKGVVSVTSNLFPREMVALVDAALAGDFAAARRSHEALLPVMRALFVETNPTPAKAALAALGALPSAAVRLPLVQPSEENAAKVIAAVRALQAAGKA